MEIKKAITFFTCPEYSEGARAIINYAPDWGKHIELVFSENMIPEDTYFLILSSPISAKIMQNSNIKFIQLISSGFDGFPLDVAKEKGIVVANNDGANAVDVAEHTLMLILQMLRRVPKSTYL